jgi:DNA mismatch repair protein MutL
MNAHVIDHPRGAGREGASPVPRMNRIRLLPETLANQIAAGEVIERPASVVKELIENALDADARRIVVEIQAGGRSLIRVSDDGIGMSRDDALLCLERHATSKIRSLEDLMAIRTLGFRGEALPSIASVSRLTLTTRERDSDQPEGTQVLVTGGRIVDVRAAGTAPGTTVEVRQLFFNVPARRKFLRSDETEAAHVQHCVLLAALAWPEVAFTFIKDGRTLWQLPAVPCGPDPQTRRAALRERLRALYGTGEALLEVEFAAPLDERPSASPAEVVSSPEPSALLRVWGFIGAPGVSRATRADQHLFVNRRPVESRTLNHALLEGYHTALMKGRYPVCCLFLELDPAAVDVNIHPAKREVKFHREWAVRHAVTQAVRQTLLAFHSAPGRAVGQATTSGVSTPSLPVKREESALPGLKTDPQTPTPSQSAEAGPGVGSFGFDVAMPGATSTTRMAPARASAPAQPGATVAVPSVFSPAPVSGPGAGAEPSAPSSTVVTPPRPERVAPGGSPAGPDLQPVPLLEVPLRFLGVLGRLYVLFESDRGLVLMDQHAAHERVLFEEMLDRLEREGQAPSQKLLLPEAVELPARDAAFLREQLGVLNRLGVGLSEFGTRTFLLDALPPFVKVPDPRRFLLDLVDELRVSGQELNVLRLGEPVVAKTVCRHAVKARDPLEEPELRNLLESLRRCRMPYTCPHGRPTLIELSYRELERKFGRVT